MASYIALIHKDENSAFGVSFPDFPGCVTAGDTLDDAARMATEALTGHIETMREFGETIPAPTPLNEIITADADVILIAPAGTEKDR